MSKFTLIILLIVCFFPASSQTGGYSFREGFDARESDDLLVLNDAFIDTTPGNLFPAYLRGYRFLYRSASMGLDNKYDLWIREDSVVIIALRGTTPDPRSIMADFYCAMIPARGKILLPGGDSVNYQLASDPRAAVHAGFLLGFAYLSKDIQPRLHALYHAGFRKIIVTGHSQGGALCYYVSAWIWHLQQNGQYPGLRVKTYASASPKMGNTYFAYDYDNLTRAGWSFSIVNSADVIPEMPLATQQLEPDMNQPNPLLSIYDRFNKLPFLQRIFLKRAFNKMQKGAEKSSATYQKYLGKHVSSMIGKMLPGATLPAAVNTTYFQRPGVPISLLVNGPYLKRFEKDNNGPYYHHGMLPYRFLLRQYYDGLSPLNK